MKDDNTENILLMAAAALGVFSLAVFLIYHNVADGDLWARLAQGASIWMRGGLIHKDVFAFTPVLPEYIDHEWGSGLLFYSLLRLFGPESLLILKVVTAVAALALAISAGRLQRYSWPVLLLLALPCASAMVSGYVLVVRSQVFTYLFFGASLLCLEAIRRGRVLPSFIIVFLMLLWANTHGGFAAGLGIIAIYALSSFIPAGAKIGGDHVSKGHAKLMSVTFLAAACVTLINPYGLKLWKYLIPALLHPRSYITEWSPMSLSFAGIDPYTGFRILLIMAVIAVAAGWDKEKWKERLPGFITLLVTLHLALRHRRHAPFFALASAAFLGPYLSQVLEKASSKMPHIIKIRPAVSLFLIYGTVALLISVFILPLAKVQVWSPIGFFPVRECDILMYSKAEGNLAVAFPWGNYAMWRLYPHIKISQCGRYETVYPESTVELNRRFFHKMGDDWDSLLKDYDVDYVILELGITRLEAEDMAKAGFLEIYSDGFSSLWASHRTAAPLLEAARRIDTMDTIQPLDAAIPAGWWK